MLLSCDVPWEIIFMSRINYFSFKSFTFTFAQQFPTTICKANNSGARGSVYYQIMFRIMLVRNRSINIMNPKLWKNKSYYMNFKLIILVIKGYSSHFMFKVQVVWLDFLNVRHKHFDSRDFSRSFYSYRNIVIVSIHPSQKQKFTEINKRIWLSPPPPPICVHLWTYMYVI